jgi:hypothetical protein
MKFISSLDQHPDVRRERFPRHLWPSSGDRKVDEESWVVVEFAEAAGLQLDSAPNKLVPPRPDFECVINGERLLIEVGEIVQSEFADGLAHSVKQSGQKMRAISRGEVDAAN